MDLTLSGLKLMQSSYDYINCVLVIGDVSLYADAGSQSFHGEKKDFYRAFNSIGKVGHLVQELKTTEDGF